MNRQSVKKLTLSSVLASLQVVILYAASLFSFLDLTFAASTVFFMMFAAAEIKGKWPVGIYAAVSILSLILLPTKFASVVYITLVGWYPIFKLFAERKWGRWISLFAKLTVFNLAFILTLEICKRVLYMEDMMGLDPVMYYAAVFVVGNITFVLFDRMMTMVNMLYVLRLRKRIGADKLFK